MLNNFIYAQSKAMFEERLHKVPNDAIVFIEDTKEIWNHGHYFGGETIDPNIISDLQTAVAQMQSSKLDSSTAESTYAKKTELPSLDGYLTENAANALYVKVSDIQGISTVISNLQTEVSTKADKATTIAGYGITDGVTKDLTGELETAHAQAICGSNYVYALPDDANGDEDDVLLSRQSVKTINGEAIYGSGDISTFHYGVCHTDEDAAYKTATTNSNFSLIDGTTVIINFVYGNTVTNTSLKLNVNNTGDFPLNTSGLRRLALGPLETITCVFTSNTWIVVTSSNNLTVGDGEGYSLHDIHDSTCGLAITPSLTIGETNGALHITHGGANENAIYCTGGNIVTETGAVQGNIVHNTRTITATTTLDTKDNIVLCNNSSAIDVKIKMNQVLSGQIFTIIKSTTANVTVGTVSPTGTSVPYLRVLGTSMTSASSHVLSGVGVWNLYCIGSYIYLYKL